MLQKTYLLVWMQLLVNIFLEPTNAFTTHSKSGELSGRYRRMLQATFPIKNDTEVCLSSICIQTAMEVLQNMDKTKNPCNDFYEFACGGYLKSTVVTENEQRTSIVNEIKYKIKDQLRSCLEESSPPNELRTFTLVKNLYKACMDKKVIENQGLHEIHKILKNLGGWPVLCGDEWEEETKFNWEDSSYEFKKVGYSPNFFLHFKVDVDARNKRQRIIHLGPAIFGYPEEYLKEKDEDAVKNPYYKYMVDIAVIFGANRKKAEVELLQSFKFEKKLAEISQLREKTTNDYSKNPYHNLMRISELVDNYPTINWIKYINQLLYPKIKIDHQEIVFVESPNFIADFEKLIASIPKRTQANYAMWRVVMNSLRYLNEEVRERQLSYFAKINKKADMEARMPMCLESAERMSISMKALYVRKYFKSWDKKNVAEIAKNIQNELKKILQNTDWLADNKKMALEKVESLSQNIAYPEEYLDDSKLEKFYTDLEITGASYLQSFLNLTKFERQISYNGLRKIVNSSDWTYHMMKQSYGGVYIRGENSIHIFASILQGTFFNSERPKYMNYGGIGFYIGHKMTHGIDNFAMSHNKPKNSEIPCLVSQYLNYSANSPLPPIISEYRKAENFADNGGIKLAYSAYENWSDRNKLERSLHGLEFTPKQMFWISFANTLCTKYHEKYIEDYSVYSPDKVRVIGAISNMPEFAKDFNCPVGSKMLPEKRCKVW